MYVTEQKQIRRYRKWVWKSLSRVQLFVTPWTVAGQAPLCMEFSGILPESTQNIGLGSHSLLQRLFLSQGLSPGLSYCRQIFTILPPGKPKNTGVGHLSLLWQIFLTQESNQILLHCRRILYQLSYQGSSEARWDYRLIKIVSKLWSILDVNKSSNHRMYIKKEHLNLQRGNWDLG